MRRRTFLIGAAAAAGGLVVGYRTWAKSFDRQAIDLVAKDEGHLIAGWLKIAPDDTVTVYIPHIDMGQGTHTALAMLAAEELDADWSKVRTLRAPGEKPFANRFLARGWILDDREFPVVDGAVDMVFTEAARQINLQITGGSTAVRFTGRYGMRFAGAAARAMLVEAAADRWNVPAQRITVRDGVVSDPASGPERQLRRARGSGVAVARTARPALQGPGDVAHRRNVAIARRHTAEDQRQLRIRHRLQAARYAACRRPLGARSWRQAGLGRRKRRPESMPGVVDVVTTERAVAVIAEGWWQARQALDALDPQFDDGGASGTRRGRTDRGAGSGAGERRFRGAIFRRETRPKPWRAAKGRADRGRLPDALASSCRDGAGQRHRAIRRWQADGLGRRAGCAGNQGAADGAFGPGSRCRRVPRAGGRRLLRPPYSAIGRIHGTCRGARTRRFAAPGETHPPPRGGVHARHLPAGARDAHFRHARRRRVCRLPGRRPSSSARPATKVSRCPTGSPTNRCVRFLSARI